MPFVPPLVLVKRLVKGSKITPAEEDQNMTDIENAANGMAAQLAAALNPNGTLKPGSVDTNAIQDRAVTLAKLAFLSSFYAVDTGSANAIAIAFVPPLTAYVEGLVFWVKVVAGNTGATTMAVDGLAPVTCQKLISTGLTNLVAGDLVTGGEYLFVNDGTVFVLLNPTPPSSITTGPVFLAIPVSVYSGGSLVWGGPGSDIDASGSVPAGAKAVILQCKGWWNTNTDGEIIVEMRPDAGGPTLIVNETGGTDAVVNVSQGMFPMTNARAFQLQVTSGDIAATVDVKIIGYVL